MALKQPALIIERDRRKKKKQSEATPMIKKPTKEVVKNNKGTTYINRDKISTKPSTQNSSRDTYQKTYQNRVVTNKDRLTSKPTINIGNKDITTIKGRNSSRKKYSTEIADIYERDGQYYYKDGNKEKTIDAKFVQNALKNNKKGVIGAYDSKGRLRETDERGNVKALEKNVFKKAGRVAKGAYLGAKKGFTGIADAAMQETRNDLQKGEKIDSYGDLAKNEIKALIHAMNPTLGRNAANKEAGKNIRKIWKDKDKTLWQKIVGTGLETINAGTVGDIQGLKESVRGIGAVDHSADEKVKKVQEKIDEPINKQLEKFEQESDKYDKTTNQIAKLSNIVGNMIPGVATSVVTKNPTLGLATMGLSAKGQSTERAEMAGADLDTATKMGTAGGWTEVGTELLTGGVPIFGKGALDDIFGNLINSKIKSKGANFVTKKILGTVGEEFEEVLSDLAGVMIDIGTIDPNAKYTLDDFLETAKDTFGSTFILNLLTGGYGGRAYRSNVANMQNYQNQMNEIVQQVESGMIDTPLANEYIKQVKNGTYQQNRNLDQIAAQQRDVIEQAVQTGQLSQADATQEIKALDNTLTSERKKLSKNAKIEAMQTRLREMDVNGYLSKNYTEKQQQNFIDKVYDDNLSAEELQENLYDAIVKDTAKKQATNILETSANRQKRRTKQQWLDVANMIGSQSTKLDSESLKNLAFGSWTELTPNQKDVLNRQGQKYVPFSVDEWVKAVYKGARVGEKIKEEINTPKQEITNNQQESAQENINNDVIDTKESKIRDDNGNLLKVYHRSHTKNIKQLEPKNGAIFFTNDPNASYYGNEKYSANLNIKNPLIIDGEGANFNQIKFDLPNVKQYNSTTIENAINNINKLTKKDVIEIAKAIDKNNSLEDFIDVFNTPKDALDSVVESYTDGGTLEDFVKQYGGLNSYIDNKNIQTNRVTTTRDIVDYAKNNGYDGVVFKNVQDKTKGVVNVYAAFNSDQIINYKYDNDDIQNIEPKQNENNVEKVETKPKNKEKTIADKDNQGRILSKEDQNRFKNSKAKNDKGELLELYHGTPNAGFNTVDDYLMLTDNKDIAKDYAGSDKMYNPDNPNDSMTTITSRDNKEMYWKKSQDIIDNIEEYTLNDLNSMFDYIDSNNSMHDSIEEYDLTIPIKELKNNLKQYEIDNINEILDYLKNEVINEHKELPIPLYNNEDSSSLNLREQNRKIYSVYANITNPLVIDKNGGKVTHDEIEQAKKDGYDGIIANNTGEGKGNKKGNTYIVFNTEQIGYANQQNIEPKQNENIPATKSENVISEPTNKPTNSIKDIKKEVEEKTNKTMSKHIETSSKATGTVEDIRNMDYDTIVYDTKTHEQSKEQALRELEGKDIDTNVNDVHAKFRGTERLTNVDSAKITELMKQTKELANEAAKNNNDVEYNKRMEQFRTLKGDYAVALSESGQFTEYSKVIKELDPDTQIDVLKKVIEREKRRGNKKYEDVIVNEKLVEKYKKAKTDEERDTIMEEIKDDTARQIKITFVDKANEFRFLSMLGNLKTHGRNIFGNAGMYSLQSFKDGVAAIGEDVYNMAFENELETRTKTLKPATKEVSKFVSDKVDVFLKDQKSKYNESRGMKGDLEGRTKKFSDNNIIGKALNKASNLNSKALDFEDRYFSSKMTKQAMKGFLTANGIETNADIEAHPELVAQALDYALFKGKEATFHQDSTTATAIRNLRDKLYTGSGFSKLGGLAVDTTLPFISTPANIAKNALEYTPIIGFGDINKQFQQAPDNMKANVVIDTLSKQFTGGALMAVGAYLASKGLIKGAGDDDKEDKTEASLGNASYSVKIGKSTYDLSWLSPTAIPFFEGVEVFNAFKKAKSKGGIKATDTADLIDTMFGTLNPMTDMSVLQSVERVITSIAYGGNAVKSATSTTFSSYLQQYIPTLFSQFAQIGDSKQRNTNTGGNVLSKTFDQIKYKIPGARNTLPEKVDVWGNTNKTANNIPQRAFEALLSPANRKDYKVDKTTKELERLARETDDTAMLPTVKNKSLRVNKKDYELRGKDFVDLQKTYGKTAKKNLDKLIESDSYKNASDTEKQKMVRKLYDYASYKAKENYAKNKSINFDSGDQTSYAMIDAFKIPYEKYVESKVSGNDSATKMINKLNKAGFSKTQKAAIMNYFDRSYYVNEDKLYSTLENSNLSDKQKELVRKKYEKSITDSERERYKRADKIGVDYDLYAKFRTYVTSDKARGESRTGGKTKRQKVIDYIQSLPLSAKQKYALYDDWNKNQRVFQYYK